MFVKYEHVSINKGNNLIGDPFGPANQLLEGNYSQIASGVSLRATESEGCKAFSYILYDSQK